MKVSTEKQKQAIPDGEKAQEILATSALKNFRIIFNSIRKHSNEIEDRCKISSSQLWVLWELYKTPGLKVTELASRLSIHQSTASNLIEKIVNRKLIGKKREDQDQRVVRLYLTEEGKDVILKAPDSPRGILREALDQLSAEELNLLEQSLENLISRIKLKDEEDAMKPLAYV